MFVQDPSTLYCCEDYCEFIQFVLFIQDPSTLYCCEDYSECIQFAMFVQDPSTLYCCEDYREFIQFATSTALRMEQEAQKATKMISVKVHPHHGSKQARRAAKERAVERWVGCHRQ